MEIGGQRSVCTVVVSVDASIEVIAEMEVHARAGLTLFGECRGFVGGALHRSDDGTRLVQYLQWENDSHYLACRDDPAWDELDSTRRFMDHVAAGRATVDARSFTVASVTGGRKG